MFGRIAKSGLNVVSPMRESVRSLYPTYHRNLVGPPRQSIPFAEKAFWGAFFVVGILGGPAWILIHLDDYKGIKKE